MRAFLVLVAATWAAAVPRAAFADDAKAARALAALERGAHGEAIREFESLADSGFVHPDASYDRAVAYAMRARSPQARPGDLGQAAAALAETLLARPDDEEARVARETVQGEIARARSRRGAEPVTVRPSIDRALIGLAPENVWAGLAALGSIVTTIGLLFYRWGTSPARKLGGSIAVWIGAILLVTTGGLAYASVHLRRTAQPAVVVVPEARILDRTGTPLAKRDGVEHASIPEGAELEVRSRIGTLSEFRWGTSEGFVRSADVRVLARP